MKMLKYGLEGLAVAVAAYYIPKREVRIKEVIMIALTAAIVFMLLDTFAPEIGVGARSGAGFGIGAAGVGFKGQIVEGMCSGKSDKKNNEQSDKMNY